MAPDLGLAGKTVVLTGAGGALGRAIAGLFLDLGSRMVLLDRDVSGFPSGARAIACDVRDATAVDRAMAEAANAGGIDHMVLAAGIYRPAPLAQMTDADWQDTLAVNLQGAFHCCRAAAPRMNKGGSIVALSSIAGQRGSAAFSHYAASKGGLLSFVRSLAVELAPDVRVNAVSPGPIDSPMVAPLMEKRGPQILAQTPLGRLGTPDEVARAVAFLASDWASYITGESLQVNGGAYLS